MTIRNPVSTTQNIWSDAEQVDNTDLTLEQEYNATIQSAIINNHIGTGIVPEVLTQSILFDSSLETGFLDGIAVQIQTQPSDTNLGNQLEIQLTGSNAAGKKAVKVAIIGLDFESNLQYETFFFYTNESQFSKKHFTTVSVILFNDFIGDPSVSLNLGGKIIIKEISPLALSRNPIMLSQEIEPNLFFRDFVPSSYASLQALLQAALPYYNIDTLNINTGAADQQILLSGDITTQIGQKFIATTNNIQKITLLLSTRNQIVGDETDLAWTGDLVVSIYPLQSTIECPTDIAPNTAIEFSPTNIPVAQISMNYNSLMSAGTILDSVPQPVDFVFSTSPVSTGNVLDVGSYYAFTIKRAGGANKCDILIDVGEDSITDSRITMFTGTVWVDLPDQDLWFKIYTDSAKVSDGQAYDSGHGIVLPKTKIDAITQATVDYYYHDNTSFTGNEVYNAVVSAITEESDAVSDPRTGQPVNSRQQLVPQIQLLNTLDLANLMATAEPLLIGAISDKNKKSFDPADITLTAKLYGATIANDEILIRIVSDTSDVGRYDTDVNLLESELLNGDLTDAKIIPNSATPNIYYRIAEAKLCSMIIGDVNGDGVVDEDDLDLLNSYIGYNFNTGLPTNTSVITNSIVTTFTNGYDTYTNSFSNAYGISFQLVDGYTNLVVASGVDGVLVANPTDSRLAQFTSSSVNFSSIVTSLSDYKLVILTSLPSGNYGGFDITALESLTDVITIRKIVLTGDAIAEMMRADIDGDFAVTANDGYLLNAHINREPYAASIYFTYPAPATNPYTLIGSKFNVIRLKLQKFIDRADDYSPVIMGRSTVIHPEQDVFIDGSLAYQLHDFYNSPISITIEKQLTWNEQLIATNSRARLVPSVFTTTSGYTEKSCSVDGTLCNQYPIQPSFDSGRVDFFVPNNVIIGDNGELWRSNGNFYKVDFEVGTIVLEIPNGLYGDERSIDIVNDFIASTVDDGGFTGVTRFGFPAMKFADCTYVTAAALTNDQIRFSVAVQSFSPNTNGISDDGYGGAIVDGKIGVAVDYTTGMVTVNFTNLFQDAILRTLSTKIQVNVYLKQGGFNNQPLFVDSTKVQNMLNLVSVFNGPVDGGPSALVDVSTEVEGVLPIVHGGTGLNSTGTYGTVLTSVGGSLSYQFIYDLPGTISWSDGYVDAGMIPKTDGFGLLDPSFYYKNPMYIYGVAGTFSHDTVLPTVIGAFSFRFDSFILQGIQDIKLEIILETTNIANTATIKLYDVTSSAYLDLSAGPSALMTTTNTSPTVIRSVDLTSQLLAGAIDYVYEIHLSLNPTSATEAAICKMARLIITYVNPAAYPPIAHSYNFVPFPTPP